MKPPLRIAVLECDTPLTGTREKYGGYGGVFTSLLKAGADSLDSDQISSKHGLDISSWNVVNKLEYPDMETADAVLITGSRHNSFDNDPWILRLVSFTQSILSQDRVRLIGVCFGHQIVGRALGAEVGRSDRGWETSVSKVQMTEKGRELFGKDEISLHQMHRDIVYTYPHTTSVPTTSTGTSTNGIHPNTSQQTPSQLTAQNPHIPTLPITPLGSSPLCDVQGMYTRNRLITVQGHPEFTEEIVRELLEARHSQGVFDDVLYGSGMERVGNGHDGVVVAGAFLRFLLEE